ncbi:3-amino-5-hydroxybenzoate synthase [Micromonospora andamanensis]|nr:3-amino-5-hydroxybenzoate synthase [Micromonospora andamanensis]
MAFEPIRTSPYPAWPRPDPAVEDAVLTVARSGHWWQSGGGAAERLEEALVAEFGVAGAVAVGNGTVALELALAALGVGADDEVLVPATTFVSTASAVHRLGARPVPVDVCPRTLTVDIDAAGTAVGPRTRAMVVVHLAGHSADLPAARRFCDARGIALVEDSAQAVTAEWAGTRVGTVGDLATLSFQAAKLLPGGDGGAVLATRDGALAERVARMANCGRRRGSALYDHHLPATNARISEFNAAVVLAHLTQYEHLAQARRTGAQRLLSAMPPGTVLAPDPRATCHDWYMVLLTVPDDLYERGLTNRHLVAYLDELGVPAQVLYPFWPDLPGFAGNGDRHAERCVVARRVTDRVAWLHHRLLLDPDFPEDLGRAWARIESAHADVLPAVSGRGV